MKYLIVAVLMFSSLAVCAQTSNETDIVSSVLATEEVYRVSLIESIQNNTFTPENKNKIEDIGQNIEQKKGELLDIVLSASTINFFKGKYHLYSRGKQYVIDRSVPLQVNPI